MEATMLELTPEQQQALQSHVAEAIRLTDPTTHRVYVLLPADVYDHLKGVLEIDGDWPAQDRLRLLAESGRRAGWDDPRMDEYNQEVGRSRRAAI
jgi:hypothetical protein